MSRFLNGRFTKAANVEASHFHSSLSFDMRLYKEDIQGSIAHADMLGSIGVISSEESGLIIRTLKEILMDIESGALDFSDRPDLPPYEDIHMFVEANLIERIGDTGKKLHTGRSRNDQVALDMRMYVKKEITAIREMLGKLISILKDLSTEHVDTIMPGYTHLQRAQPVTLAHHLMAYAEMFRRDDDRLKDTYKRTDIMPLGSGALAATIYPLDRRMVCELLGFSDITSNSMDAVSDRDFCIELCAALSILMMHLSRFCEEIVLWVSHEFRFAELDDSYSTGSSIMPQKKNPDMAELIRGKTGRVYGDLMGLLTMMKGLPLAYNKDLQEDKEQVFDAIDTAKMIIPVFCGMIVSLKFNKQNMYSACGGGFVNATDAADWLVKKGVPFRDAHEIIGKLVLYCIRENKTLEELSVSEYREVSEVFDDSIYHAISLEQCVEARNIEGGPGAKINSHGDRT